MHLASIVDILAYTALAVIVFFPIRDLVRRVRYQRALKVREDVELPKFNKSLARALMAVAPFGRREKVWYLAASGRRLMAEVIWELADGSFYLRRPGHLRSMPFLRAAGEVFPR